MAVWRDAIKALLRERGMTQQELARLAGISRSTVLHVVKGGHCSTETLELIADTYLSVSTMVQTSAAALITSGAAIRAQIIERAGRNLDALAQLTARHPALNLLKSEGGWSAVLRVPAVRTEESLVVSLIEEDGVLVHPGYFFDFAHEAYLVVSLITPPADFDAAIERIARRAA